MPEPGLRERTLASVFWVTAFNVVRAATLFLLPAAIAWVSGPVELGLAQLAYGIYVVALPFVALGTRAAVLQHPAIDQRYLSSVFYLNLLTGAVTGAVLSLGAPWIAAVGHGDPRLVTVVRWLGAVCLTWSLTVVQSAMLARRLAFRSVSLANIAGAAAGAVAGLAAAAAGWRLGAVGAAAGAYVLVTTVALWRAGRWWPSLVFDPALAAGALRFGLTASAASVANTLAGQLERFLLSAALGPAALGLYGAARNVNRDALRNLMSVTDEVLLPGLASVRGEEGRARAYYLKALRFEFLAFAPAAVWIAICARDLVVLIYGADWLSIVPLVRWLTPLVLFTITNHTIGAVFLSSGRPDVQLRWSLLSIPLVALYVLCGWPWGLTGIVAALSVLEGIGWWISHGMANRLIGLPARRFLENLARPLAITLVFGALFGALRQVPALAGGTPSWGGLAAWAAAALVLYAGLLHAGDRGLSRDFWRAVTDVLRVRRPSAGPGRAS